MVNKMKTRQFIIITLIMAGTKLVNLSQAAIQPPRSNTINVDRERQAQNVTLRSSLPAMVHTRQMSMGGEVYDQLLISGGTLLQAGAPNVPAVSRWVAIPVGVIPQLQVIPGKAVEVGCFNIDPVQPLRVDGDAPPPPFVKTEAIYADDSFYPGTLAEITQQAKLRGQPMVLVEIHPYQYNPISGRLVCYPELTVDIVAQGGNSPANRLRSKAGDTRLQHLDPTVGTVLSLPSEPSVQPLATGFGDDDDRCEFLIICDPSYENAANRLATWRMYENMPTVVATTDETGSTTNEIQDYIRHAYTNWSLAPSYCLLIGDSDDIPVIYSKENVPTDFHYGEMDGDLLSDIAMGRWPVNSSSNAEDMVDAVISYESSMKPESFYTSAALAAAFQDGEDNDTDPDFPVDGYADRRFAKTSEDLHSGFISNGISPQRIYATLDDLTGNNADQEILRGREYTNAGGVTANSPS